jgi:hypothetical protein
MNRALLRIAAVSCWLCAAQVAHALDSWSLQLSAEAGAGMRAADIPRDGVIYQIRTGMYPALGLAFELRHYSSQRFSLGLLAHYQSSIGLVLREQLTGGTEHARKTRSHRAEVAIAPSWHWGDAGGALTGAVGYSISELDPENHLLMPSYHLGGPFARIGVLIPLGSPSVALRVAPDAQLCLQVGDELRALGVASSGVSVGASAAVELRLSERWLVAVTYREQHSWLAASRGPGFDDTLRFATAQLRGQL